MNGWVLPDDVLRDAPTYTPRPHELADLELLLSGAYAPLTGFLGRADLHELRRTGRLADGTPWPVPVTLEVPQPLVEQLDRPTRCTRVTGADRPRGRTDRRPSTSPTPGRPATGTAGVGGPVRRIGDGGHGPFRRLRRTPGRGHGRCCRPGRVLGVIADRPLHRPQLAQIAHAARTLAAHLLVLVPVAGPGPDGLAAEALVRCDPRGPRPDAAGHDRGASRCARTATRSATRCCARGWPPRTGSPTCSPPASRCSPAAGCACWCRASSPTTTGTASGAGATTSRRATAGSPLTPPRSTTCSTGATPLPEWHTPPAVARELARARPPRRQRGLVVFFTGLSGSGKSTIARGLADTLRETGERTITLLDGDVVRRRALRRARLLQGRPRPQRPPDRLGRGRGRPARRDGRVLPDRAVRGSPRGGAPDGAGRRRRASCSCTCRRPGRGLRAARPQGPATRRPAPVSSRGMTGIDDPYEVPANAELIIDTTAINVRARRSRRCCATSAATAGWSRVPPPEASPKG